MKEFGNKKAAGGTLLCEAKDCEANRHPVEFPASILLTQATGHELLRNHPTVVVYHDTAHKVSAADAVTVLKLTGIRIPEDIIE